MGIALVGVFQAFPGLIGYVGNVHVLGQDSVHFVNVIDIVYLQGPEGVFCLNATDVGPPPLGFGEDGGVYLDHGGGSKRLECIECCRGSSFLAVFGEADVYIPFFSWVVLEDFIWMFLVVGWRIFVAGKRFFFCYRRSTAGG
jgi:hypothetical protein